MKKTNPFKLYALLIGGFIFLALLIPSIVINIVWQSQKQDYHTYNSVSAYQEHLNVPSYDIHSGFYDMYDAYEFIINDKEILMSDKQLYIINQHYQTQYEIEDYGKTQLNAKYTIYLESLDQSPIHYEHDEAVYAGHLYVRKTDFPHGIEFAYVDSNRPIAYSVTLTITEKDDININEYIDKIKDYIILTEKHNK